MNGDISGTAPIESIPPFKDRSAGLVVFGILTLLMGCLAGLFTLLILVAHALTVRAAMVKSPGPAAMPMSSVLFGVLIYGALAVAFAWLGIGSIMKRRWARALLLIFSWCWLIMGIFSCIGMAFVMPGMLKTMSSDGTPDPNHPALSPEAILTVIGVVSVTFVIIFVILPTVWISFYGSRHVKATAERLDPVVRWTDRCPLPVLAACLWLGLSVPGMLLMIPAYHGVAVFFGIFLVGWPGALFYLLIAVIWGYAARSIYRLERRGWWVVFIAICLLAISAALTFARHDIMEMYRLMGYPQAQIEQIQKFGLLSGNRMEWMTLGSMVPCLGYLLFIRKFLRDPSDGAKVLANPVGPT